MITYRQLLEKWIGQGKHSIEGGGVIPSKDIFKEDNNIHDPVKLHPLEVTSLRNYSTTSYDGINNHLRHGYYLGAPKKSIKHLSNAINKHTTKNDIHVWRSYHDFDASNLKKGETYHDKGFVSTTLRNNHKGHLDNSNMLHIKIPKGSKALYMNQQGASSFPHEHEILLNKGARFKYHGSKTHTVPFPADMRNPTRKMTIHQMTYLGSDE